jgi:uncharacterized protein
MNWQGGRRSANVEDRRGQRFGRPLALGGGASLVLLLVSLVLGVDLTGLNSGSEDPGVGGAGPTANAPVQASPEEEQLREFVSVVLGDTEATWPAVLQPMGLRYQEPKLVLFRDAVRSGCGAAQSAVGPFYCPADEKLYLDLGFFEDLERLGAPGDFAQAYVIAHEVGHHVQNLMGISERAQRVRERSGERAANAMSVRVELQADCFAGVWAHHAQQERALLERGDVEEGLGAAAAVGDDRLQARARGRVAPESFTHGSSAERARWFRRGLDTGDVKACDTFGGAQRP